MSHARSKHPGNGAGLEWAVRVTKLCLGTLFAVRGIPQLYYGTEIGMEGWKTSDGDYDMRRDFPWQIIGNDNRPRQQFSKEKEIYDWTRDLIKLRKIKPSLRYGTTITLWSDDLVYAFLRISTDDISLVVVNNGYFKMPFPLKIPLNKQILPNDVIKFIINGHLKHWKTQQPLSISNDMPEVTVAAKTIDFYI